MDYIELLTIELDRLNRAIEALGGVPAKKCGRSAKVASVRTVAIDTPKKRKPRTFTAAQRKQTAIRMKKYWAQRRKAAKAKKAA